MRPALERALRHHRRGELDQAEPIYRRILAASPQDPDALNLLGCVELARGNRDTAIGLMKQAVAVAPRVPQYHENLAEGYFRNGQVEPAESECRRALSLEPGRPQALNRMGLIAVERGDYEMGRTCFAQALQRRPAYPEAMSNLAIALNRVGDHDLARKYCELALRLEPRSPAAWNNLGMAYKGMGRLREAKASFAKAGDFPIAKFNLGYVHLLEDDLATGLPLCEWRKRLANPGKGLEKPEWDGRAAGERLLVLHEQGLGDTILMSQFFVPLLERFRHVTVQVPAPMCRLIATLDPRLVVRSEIVDADFDQWCATMSLPLLLGIDAVGKIPATPWLPMPGQPRRARKLRIGINWAGNPKFHYDRIRSARLEDFAPLLDIPGVEWVSLHRGHREAEAERFGLPQPLRGARDFHDTAEVLGQLDMVVSTETAVPNLSAALGIPTCVMAAVDHDWRWRSWFKGVVVCRQETTGVWSGAVSRAAQIVAEQVARGGRMG